MRRTITILLLAAVAMLIVASSASAAFGLAEYNVQYESEGEADTQAGSHPETMTVPLRFTATPTGEGGALPDAPAKDVFTTQIPGFVGDPTAVPQCPTSSFLTKAHNAEGFIVDDCPDSAVLGYAVVTFANRTANSKFYAPVYNLEPGPGVAARLGFTALGVPVPLELRVSESPPYEIVGGPTNISQVLEIASAKLVLWGNPTDPRHDRLRGDCLNAQTGGSAGECPSGLAGDVAFLTLPRACTGPLQSHYAADSWSDPGADLANGQPDLSDPSWVTGSVGLPSMTGCTKLKFTPEIANQPTEHAAESPTGLNFDLTVSDPGLTEPSARADSDIEKAVVTLPEGVTTNPSVASGLGACTSAQYASAHLGGEAGCPESSKVGSVEVESPLLELERGGPLRVLHGSIYVAAQHDNPFNNLLTVYMIIEEPALGIFIKVPGRVDPDPSSGRLTTTFEGLPQLPFSHFHLHFREGDRAPLITPAACGTYTTEADLYPYSRPGQPVHQTATFEITSGAGGSGCASSPSGLPNHPAFSAGTVDPTAGAFSPFVLNLKREDGSQQFSRIEATLPKGLLGRLAGIPYCSDAQIGQASSRSGEGEGAQEAANPSCPQASEVGTVAVGAGAGPSPYYVSGHAYLAGPYKGAPLSLEIVTPAIAGPFDLGTVAVRTALNVDPLTAEITAVSDPIPTILHGLPLDVRSIALDMNRPSFTLNPTSCEPKQIDAKAISTLGSSASVSSLFQAANCAALKFAPKLQLSLKGSTTRTGHPALKAVLTYPKGGAYANIARAQVNLPHSEFIEQSNLNKACTKPVLLEGKCPQSTIYGKAKAWTPLLDKPLEGNVYLVGGFGFKLPALVAELNGQIRILLAGKVDSGPNNGIRNTFEAVPDAPVEKFELNLKGGPKYSLLVNSENLCKKPQNAITRFTAQNGRVTVAKPLIANQCGKGRAHKKHGAKKHSAGKHGKK